MTTTFADLLVWEDLPASLRYEPNDTGNAERFAARFQTTVCFVEGRGWGVFNGIVWEFSDTQRKAPPGVYQRITQVTREALDDVEHALALAPDQDTEKALKKLGGAISRGLSRRGADDIVAMAERQDLMLRDNESFDTVPSILATKNTVVDLATGETIRPAHGLHLTAQAAVDYSPDARSELWEDTLLAIFSDEPERVRFFQQWVGYCLTGEVNLEKMLVLYGGGANGKNVIVDTLERVLGGAVMAKASMSIFDKVESNGHDAQAFGLVGRRLCWIDENDTNLNKSFSEAEFKSRVGGNTISPRAPYGTKHVTFPVQAKFLLTTNHAPEFPSQDDGTWRRVWVMPLNESFFPHPVGKQRQRDDTLKDQFREPAHQEAVLAWAIEGARMFYENGRRLDVPALVEGFTLTHKESANPLSGFYTAGDGRGWLVDSHADPKAEGKSVLLKDTMESYRKFCDEMGIDHPLGPRSFKNLVLDSGANYGVAQVKKKRGAALVNVKLTTEAERARIFELAQAEEYMEEDRRGHDGSEDSSPDEA